MSQPDVPQARSASPKDAAARTGGEFKAGASDEERWSWLLLLLDAAEQAGLTPISVARFHQLAYFANCLAPVYDLPAEDGKVMKFVRGPHFTNFQWDLDRLVVLGKISVRNFEPFEDLHGWWFTASYVLSDGTFEEINTIRVSPRLARVHDFQVELAFAFASLTDEVQETSPDRDATYADPLAPEGEIVDFAEWDPSNYTKDAVDGMTRYVPAGLRLQPRDRIHLYFRYLTRVDPVQKQAALVVGGRTAS